MTGTSPCAPRSACPGRHHPSVPKCGRPVPDPRHRRDALPLPHSPELPSIIQELIDESRDRADAPSCATIVCGSTLTVMSQLLSGTKPLRGGAGLDLAARPFGFRDAAAYCGVADPQRAFLVHAVLGGTPGYRPLIDVAPPAAVADQGEVAAPGRRGGARAQRRSRSCRTPLLAIGEAKASGRPRVVSDVLRLERMRGLLVDRGLDAADATLAVFGRSGFDREVIAVARDRRDVDLVDLATLSGADA